MITVPVWFGLLSALFQIGLLKIDRRNQKWREVAFGNEAGNLFTSKWQQDVWTCNIHCFLDSARTTMPDKEQPALFNFRKIQGLCIQCAGYGHAKPDLGQSLFGIQNLVINPKIYPIRWILRWPLDQDLG